MAPTSRRGQGLRVIRRKDTDTLWIVGTLRQPGEKVGRLIRRSAGTDDEDIARTKALQIETEAARTAWLGERPSTHDFSEAVVSYLKTEERSEGTKAYVHRLLLHFRTIQLGTIDQEAWDDARDKLLREGAGPGAEARILGVLLAILHHAAKRKWVAMPHIDKPPSTGVRTRFFMPVEAERLIAEGRHCAPLLRFLFCTGCRLSEALALDWDAVDLAGAMAHLWEGETKSDLRRDVDLPPAAVAVLGSLDHREGRVFLDHHGNGYRIEGDYGGQIDYTWNGAMERIGLTGLTPHHTRHTWATWHYAIHKDLLLLQHDGTWSSVDLVTRYAKLMPAGHENEIRRVWGMVPERRGRRRA